MSDNVEKQSGVTRRNFLGMAWGVSLVALVGQAGVGFLNFFKPNTKVGGYGGEIVAGKPKEFKRGTVTPVQAGHFYISSLEDGGYLAIWWRCTHLGCTVPWRKDEKQFHCPCHSSLYNPQGEVIGGPAPRPLDIFPMKLDADGNLVVDTGNPIAREKFDPSQEFHV